jgi:hypothetical protein
MLGFMVDVQLHRSITGFGDIADHLHRRDPVLFTLELGPRRIAPMRSGWRRWPSEACADPRWCIRPRSVDCAT